MTRALNSTAFLLTFALTMPAVLAHPGHYHPPGEDDEFNALRADWLHIHGWVEMALSLVALFAVVLFVRNRRCAVRIGATIVFGGSLALIAAF